MACCQFQKENLFPHSWSQEAMLEIAVSLVLYPIPGTQEVFVDWMLKLVNDGRPLAGLPPPTSASSLVFPSPSDYFYFDITLGTKCTAVPKAPVSCRVALEEQ